MIRPVVLRVIGLVIAVGGFVVFAMKSESVQLAQGQPSCTLTIKANESIQKAIDAALPGAVLCLEAGTWQENLKIEKNLTLRGAGPGQTVLKGIETGKPVVRVETDAEIQLTLEAIALTEGKLAPVMRVAGKAKVNVNNVMLSDGFFGLQLAGVGVATVSNTVITKNGFDGIRLEGASVLNLQGSHLVGNLMSGIILKDASRAEIKESLIDENRRCGIDVPSSEAQARGTPNEMRSNGADLCGFAAAGLRKPLVSPGDKNQLTVPGDFANLQEAIDAVAPNGMVTVQKGAYDVGLTLWKPMTLRGAGRAETILKAYDSHQVVVSVIAESKGVIVKDLGVTESQGDGLLIFGQATLQNLQSVDNRHRGVEIGGAAEVIVQGALISGNRGDGLGMLDTSQLVLADSVVTGNGSNAASGLDIKGSANVRVTNSQVISNRGRGFDIGVSAQLNIANSKVSTNDGDGIVARDAAAVNVQGSEINGNGGHGFTVLDKAQVTIAGSSVSSNGGSGIDANGAITVDVRQSTIEQNGTKDECARADTTCNGVVIVASTKLTLQDSIVRNNADWGVGVWLRRCAATFDFFSGQAIFSGTNTISDNNKSGNLNGRGNPGNHNFKSGPDGQVCLP